MTVTFSLHCGPEEYSINMSNANAYQFLEGIGREKDLADWCGEWKQEDLPEILKLIHFAQQQPLALTRDTVVDGNFIDLGIGLHYVERRLEQFESLILYAIRNKTHIVFS